jgi:hypothetical protein
VLVWQGLADSFRERWGALYTDLVLRVRLKSLDRRQAGRIFNRRGVTDLLADLHDTRGRGCVLVVAILWVIAGLHRSLNQA